MLALIVKGTPEFEPDTKNSYSNSGYFVLGLILEKVTGKPYAKALEERISSRIGLKDTYRATGYIDASKGEALTYSPAGRDWKQGFETHPGIGFQLISSQPQYSILWRVHDAKRAETRQRRIAQYVARIERGEVKPSYVAGHPSAPSHGKAWASRGRRPNDHGTSDGAWANATLRRIHQRTSSGAMPSASARCSRSSPRPRGSAV